MKGWDYYVKIIEMEELRDRVGNITLNEVIDKLKGDMSRLV